MRYSKAGAIPSSCFCFFVRGILIRERSNNRRSVMKKVIPILFAVAAFAAAMSPALGFF